MKTYKSFGHHLPWLKAPLFGDRATFGLVSNRSDPMWDEWEEKISAFYEENQRNGIGKAINNAGYRVLEKFDFTGKTVMEIGPGSAPHVPFFKTKPAHMILVDIREDFLVGAAKKFEDMGISCETMLISPETPNILPISGDAVDALLSFYSLEHLYPLQGFVDEYKRVLRPDGHLIGGIPAEGGLAWGLGRFLTSRRWLKNATTINPDKLICWEPPNFADHILTTLSQSFELQKLTYWPLKMPLIDINLIVTFIGQVRESKTAT